MRLGCWPTGFPVATAAMQSLLCLAGRTGHKEGTSGLAGAFPRGSTAKGWRWRQGTAHPSCSFAAEPPLRQLRDRSQVGQPMPEARSHCQQALEKQRQQVLAGFGTWRAVRLGLWSPSEKRGWSKGVGGSI